MWCVSACVDTRLSVFPLHVARQGKLKRPKFGSNVSVRWEPFWKAAAGQAANTHLFWFGVGKKKHLLIFYESQLAAFSRTPADGIQTCVVLHGDETDIKEDV